MGFFQRLGNFFKRLFGGKPAPQTPPASPDITPAKPQNTPPPPPPPDPEIKRVKRTQGRVVMKLERLGTEGDAIRGKVYLEDSPVGFSLEHASDAIEKGEYDLQLRDQGGLHATYAYRYPDMHEGMIQIGGKFAYLRTGGFARDAGSGIVLADSIQEQGGRLEAWNSEQAYRKIYPRLKALLKDGESIMIRIE